MFEKSGKAPSGKPEVVEMNLPISYSIPFEWGAFKVTEEANQAYGLTSLATGTQKGDFEPVIDEDKELFPVVVRLIGPSEIPSDSPRESMIFIGARPIRNGFIVNTGFHNDRNEAIEQVKKLAQEELGVDEEELDEFVSNATETEDSLTEFLEKNMPQMMAHIVSPLVGDVVKMGSAEMRREIAQKDLLRTVTAKGIGGLATGSAMAAADGFGAAGALFGAYFTGIGMWMARNDIKHYFATTRSREMSMMMAGTTLADKVSSDIHDAYCTAHFDQEFEQRLD